MSDLSRQIFESVHSLPNEVAHPAIAVGSLAVAALLAGHLRWQYGHTEEAEGTQVSNPALLEKTFGKDEDAGAIRRSRIMPTILTYVGTGLAVMTIAGGVNYKSSEANSGANAFIVNDVTNTMIRTHDMGHDKTRSDAVSEAISSLDFQGSLGEIQSATLNPVTVPLSHDWRLNKYLTKTVPNDPGQGNLKDAIEKAAEQLPVNAKNNKKRDGTVVVISDGQTDASTPEFTAVAKELQAKGVKLSAIVPGTSTGSYVINGQTIDSPASATKFSGFGNGNIHTASTAKDLKSEVEQVVAHNTNSHQEHSYFPPILVGLALAAYGIFKNQIMLGKRRR